MTELDKKILYELDQDGRRSYSAIAKNIGTSAQVVKYHVEQLLDSGIIKHFWAFVDYDKADYSFFWGYWLKFSGLTKDKETAMYADFVQNKFIPIVMRCDGYADVMLGIIARDVFHHNQLLQDIFAKYGAHIVTSEIVVGLGFLKFPRSYFVGKQNVDGDYKTSGGTVEKVALSELDRKILSLLQIDGRMEFTRMGKLLGISPVVAQKHFQKLKEKKVITKITYTLNYDKAGLKLYRVLFKIAQFNSVRAEALYLFCLRHSNIINYVKVMGNWQLMLDIEIENREKLRDLIRQMKQEFQDIIFQLEINEVYQVDKFTQMAIEYPELAKTIL